MRRLILLLTGASVAVLLGVTVVDAQRPGRTQNPNRARVAAQGNRPAPQVGQAFGRGGRGGGMALADRGRGGQARGGGFGRGLDLTDEQRDAMQDLRRGTRDQSAETVDALQTAKHALHRAIYADERNDSAVADLASQVAAFEQQLAGLRLQSDVAIADLLTAEQKEAMRTQQAGRRGGRGR